VSARIAASCTDKAKTAQRLSRGLWQLSVVAFIFSGVQPKGWPNISNHPNFVTPFTLASFALALLLVFRTNSRCGRLIMLQVRRPKTFILEELTSSPSGWGSCTAFDLGQHAWFGLTPVEQ
jgi:hypothetical protein